MYITISQIKIDLPDLSTLHDDSHMETDVRFAGAFVLYNYARLATLVNHHKQTCDKGVCVCVGGCGWVWVGGCVGGCGGIRAQLFIRWLYINNVDVLLTHRRLPSPPKCG